MFKELHQCDVPLLIFSAGLGDVIEEVVKVRTTLLPNIKVVSNYMDFDKEVIFKTKHFITFRARYK